jgi:hypothetical protein
MFKMTGNQSGLNFDIMLMLKLFLVLDKFFSFCVCVRVRAIFRASEVFTYL